ncbi:MAG: MoaD/ThiS family protein [Candidatus Bipolaricaulota bacterium]
MIEVHLYGKLRRFAAEAAATSNSVVELPHRDGDTIGSVVERIGIAVEDLGSNIFVNGRYANLESPVQDGDRLGLFPDDMQLLYKWYFAPQDTAGAPRPSSGDPARSKEPEK